MCSTLRPEEDGSLTLNVVTERPKVRKPEPDLKYESRGQRVRKLGSDLDIVVEKI